MHCRKRYAADRQKHHPSSDKIRALACFLLCLGLMMPLASLSEESANTIVSQFYLPGYPPPEVPLSGRVEDEHFEGQVLIGDSLGNSLRLNKTVPKLNIIAKVGQSPQGAARIKEYKLNGQDVRLIDVLRDLRPKVLYIWLGGNGLDLKKPDQVIAEYENLLDLFIGELPDTLIYCVSVSPIIEGIVRRSYPSLTSSRINLFNDKLRDLARERHCYFLNIHEALVDENGGLTREYAAGDGWHMSKAGYRALSDYLYTHVLPVKGE